MQTECRAYRKHYIGYVRQHQDNCNGTVRHSEYTATALSHSHGALQTGFSDNEKHMRKDIRTSTDHAPRWFHIGGMAYKEFQLNSNCNWRTLWESISATSPPVNAVFRKTIIHNVQRQEDIIVSIDSILCKSTHFYLDKSEKFSNLALQIQMRQVSRPAQAQTGNTPYRQLTYA